ncbi:hypothetical protein LCGC14_1542840 [marine sediment metagenome]|uniref:Uncharacterized protein n=1 Tax=marine sediment metagenome TaxID=412755 RepID=A0A0F9L8M7_9ZZZZ
MYSEDDECDYAVKQPISDWLAERLANFTPGTEREWRNEQIAKRLKEIEEGTYE